MQPRRFLVTSVPSFGLGLVCLCLSGGCGDDSKTTGTQIQISPEVKAELNDMRAAQKEVRAERKREREEARAKGRPGS
jgi:hypothetical protein